MLQAHDGYRVSDRTETIPFSGYYFAGDKEVVIEARDPSTGTFEPIANAQVDGSPALQIDGIDMYPWSTPSQIPHQYWERAGCVGAMASVRARVPEDGFNLQSVEEDWWSCATEYGSLVEAANNCAAEESPVARIYTELYEDVPDLTVGALHVSVGGCDGPGTGSVTFEVAGLTPPSWHGPYHDLIMRVSHGSDEQGVACAYNPATAFASCSLPLGDAHLPDRLFANAAEFAAAFDDVYVRFYGEMSCDPPTMVRYATRSMHPASSAASVLIPPSCEEPPPPPPPAGNRYDFSCLCQTTDGASSTWFGVDAYACYDAAAGHPPAGIGWACSQAQSHVQAYAGQPVICDMWGYEAAGSCSEQPFGHNHYLSVYEL